MPFVPAGRGVTRPSLVIVPANWVNIFTPAEKASKELDLFFSSGFVVNGQGFLSIGGILGLSLILVAMFLPQRRILSPQACILICEPPQFRFNLSPGSHDELGEISSGSQPRSVISSDFGD